MSAPMKDESSHVKQSKPADPLTVKCIYCGAKRGEKCVRMGPWGWRHARTHRARQLYANQVRAQKKSMVQP